MLEFIGSCLSEIKSAVTSVVSTVRSISPSPKNTVLFVVGGALIAVPVAASFGVTLPAMGAIALQASTELFSLKALGAVSIATGVCIGSRAVYNYVKDLRTKPEGLVNANADDSTEANTNVENITEGERQKLKAEFEKMNMEVERITAQNQDLLASMQTLLTGQDALKKSTEKANKGINCLDLQLSTKANDAEFSDSENESEQSQQSSASACSAALFSPGVRHRGPKRDLPKVSKNNNAGTPSAKNM